MTWQEAAKGIPVWEGCLATDGDGDNWRILETGGRFYVARIRHPRCGNVCEGRPIDLVPDLTDPDTRAAYIRRLAVALGCPEEVADQEVAFRPCPNRAGWWHVYAGHPGSDEDGPFVSGWVSATLMPETTNRDLALALAWPADKRVTT